MHRRSRKILIGIGVVVFVLGAIYAAALTKSMVKLRAAYAALEQDGRPMDASEVIPPGVPQEENAAPLYERAAAMLREEPAPKKNLLEYLGQLSFSFRADSLEPNKLPELKELMAQEVVVSALATAEEAARRPAFRFDRDYTDGLSEKMPSARELPLERKVHLARKMRYLAGIWGAKALLEATDGNPRRAWDMVRTQFTMAEALRSDPVFQSQIHAIGTIRDSCLCIQRLCELSPPDVETYQEIEDALKNLDDIAPLVRALDTERLLKGEWLFNLPEGRLYKEFRDDPSGPFGSGPEFFARLAFRAIAFRPRLVADHATYLEFMRKGVLFLEGPYVPPEAEPVQELWALAGRHILTSDLTPMLDLEKKFHSLTVARLGVTRAGLALLQYRQTHGALPPTLDKLGLDGPIDPFTQKPLLYRPEGDGFVVYSVDEDQRDNGGSPRQPRQKTDYDLVWRFPRPVAQAGGGNS